jgi:hypothetical protein
MSKSIGSHLMVFVKVFDDVHAHACRHYSLVILYTHIKVTYFRFYILKVKNNIRCFLSIFSTNKKND